MALLWAAIPLGAADAPPAGRLRLAALFSDRAVLQHGRPCPVWGWADPGETVRIAMAGSEVSTVAAADGAWRASLPALPAGGPFTLTATSPSAAVRVEDVQVGEVWLCAGQAGMGLAVVQTSTGIEDLEAGGLQGLRLFTVAPLVAGQPAPDADGGWEAWTPASGAWFSAVASRFGRRLHQDRRMAVGLIQATWGEGPIEAWTPSAPPADYAKQAMPADAGAGHRAEADLQRPRFSAAIARWKREVFARDRGNRGFKEGWAGVDHDVTGWGSMELPTRWELADPPLAIDGAVWFRKQVAVPAAWLGTDLDLRLGAIDDLDTTYFNGVQVGAARADAPFWWEAPRAYTVPAGLVTPDANWIAVRVFDMWGSGGMLGGPDWMTLAPTGQARDALPIPLAGPWRFRVEAGRDDAAVALVPRTPAELPDVSRESVLFNGMIAPVIPYALGGVIWQHGEAEAARAEEYRRLFAALITGWRAAWQHADLPFLFVQAGRCAPGAGAAEWPWLREAQASALQLPGTGMAATIDLPRGVGAHSLDQRTVGDRLAALVLTGRPAPAWTRMRAEGSAIALGFSEAGLVHAAAGHLSGFTVAGADRVFVRASARQLGDEVLVWNEGVPAPSAVRYAWDDDQPATLLAPSGSPIPPFRTDDW